MMVSADRDQIQSDFCLSPIFHYSSIPTFHQQSAADC